MLSTVDDIIVSTVRTVPCRVILCICVPVDIVLWIPVGDRRRVPIVIDNLLWYVLELFLRRRVLYERTECDHKLDILLAMKYINCTNTTNI